MFKINRPDHFTGANHLRKIEAIREIQNNLDTNTNLNSHCTICYLICSSSNQLKYHYESEGHKKILDDYIEYFVLGKNWQERKIHSDYHERLETFDKKTIIFLNRDLLDVYRLIENSINYDFIEYEFKRNTVLFQNCVRYLRSLKNSASSSQDKQDSDFDELLQLNGVEDQFIAKSIKADGNCLYRSLSFIIFHDEKYFSFIKACCIFILTNYTHEFEEYFKIIFTDYKSKIINMIKKNVWGDESTLLALVILFNRPLISLSIHKGKSRMYPSQIIFKIDETANEPLIIGHMVNHFVAICKKSEEQFIPEFKRPVIIILKNHLFLKKLDINLYNE